MKFSYKITAETGIHGRAAAHIVNMCQQFNSDISIVHNGRIGNVNSIVSLVSLEGKQDDIINILIDGEDECMAYDSLKVYFKNNF